MNKPLSMLAACALFAAPALAQDQSAKDKAEAPPSLTVAAAKPARTAAALPRGTVLAAAGSVFVMTDGVMTHAAMAQVHTPAPGFVYER